MSERTRGIVMSVSGLAVLALNVIDAANRGASAFNFLSIAVGAFLLFYGFAVVARTGAPPPETRPPGNPPPGGGS